LLLLWLLVLLPLLLWLLLPLRRPLLLRLPLLLLLLRLLLLLPCRVAQLLHQVLEQLIQHVPVPAAQALQHGHVVALALAEERREEEVDVLQPRSTDERAARLELLAQLRLLLLVACVVARVVAPALPVVLLLLCVVGPAAADARE
jgi:hypothetical protein